MQLGLKNPLVWTAAGAIAAFASGTASAQHISIDGRFSPAQTLLGPTYTIGANLGKQVGGNLFQSFGIFGLTTGEKATFTGPSTVTNVIGRVTGGSASSVNGTIQSTIPGANVYLINPAGIIFGPNATINVSGSFYASSADYVRMSDGARFQATNPDASTLSAAAPAAFGFLNAAPPAITVNGATLQTSTGQTLGLVGGPINIAGATLNAPRGTIQLAAVASTGEVPVNPLNQSALTVTQMAPISIMQSSTLGVGNFFAGAGGAGSMFVNAGAVTIDDSTIEGISNGPAAGGPINIAASSLSLTDSASILSNAFGTGNSGPITVNVSGALSLTNSSIASNTFGAGSAGAISITAPISLAISNGGAISSMTDGAGNAASETVSTGTLSLANGQINSNTFSTGNGGSIGITATNGSLTSGPTATSASPTGGGEIGSLTDGAGHSGNVSVNVAGTLTVDGKNASTASPSGIFSQAGFYDQAASVITGNSGQVAITAGSLSVVNQGFISTSSAGPGSAGQVNINATNLSLANSGVILSDTFGVGNAGQVNITAGNIEMIDSGEIASTTQSTSTIQAKGNAGSVSVDVSGSLTVDGTGATEANPTGIFALALSGTGNAGQVGITAANLSVINSGGISTTTFSTGNAGQVVVDAGNLSVATNGSISSSTFNSGVAGQVNVDAGNLSVTGGGSLFTSTFGAGNAGQTNITAGSITLASGGKIASTTTGTGAGGDVVINSPQIDLTDQGTQITAVSSGTGAAGSITVSSVQLTLQNGAAIATQAASANGGNLTLSVADFLYLVSSKITTSVLGASGNGGNITIDPQLLVLDHSSIIAQAVAGHGGNITITANDFLPSDDSIVSASSQLGISGSVELIGPRVDLNGSLVVLPSDLRSATAVLRDSCATRGNLPRSTLTEAALGGLPQDTETAIPSLYGAGRDVDETPRAATAPVLRVGTLRPAVQSAMGCS